MSVERAEVVKGGLDLPEKILQITIEKGLVASLGADGVTELRTGQEDEVWLNTFSYKGRKYRIYGKRETISL